MGFFRLYNNFFCIYVFQEWLRRHQIPFEATMLRPQLLELARLNRPPSPTYAIDELIRENGHEVLRLPPYYPDFNAIELIWSQLKATIRQKNVTFRFVLVIYMSFFDIYKCVFSLIDIRASNPNLFTIIC